MQRALPAAAHFHVEGDIEFAARALVMPYGGRRARIRSRRRAEQFGGTLLVDADEIVGGWDGGHLLRWGRCFGRRFRRADFFAARRRRFLLRRRARFASGLLRRRAAVD